MNANRFWGYVFMFCPAVILLVIGTRPATSTAYTSISPAAELNPEANTVLRKIEALAKSASVADTSARQPYRGELRLDHLQRMMPGELKTTVSETMAAPVQMALDDGQLEQAYGFDDGMYAYQFIWLNRFTPQASDFPFILNEIWVMFDDTTIDANLNVGDEIDLAVYWDADGEPSNGATWLATYPGEILAVDGETWSMYSLSPPLTLADPGDVLIGAINRYVISGISAPSYMAAIDTTASQERSWIGWWSADPPDPPELPPDDTLALMSGENAGNWLIRGYGGSPTANTYLPVVVNVPAPPSIPTLFDIDNADGDGSFTINWSAASLATTYTLEEDDNADFSSPIVIYSGTGATITIAGKALGIYYYRVRAENSMGDSDWSEVKTTSVTQQPEIICETHEFGTVGVAWPILPSGRSEHFSAENNMLVETIEVQSILKALFPVNVYVAAGINGVQLASKTHYVFSNVYTPYTINKNVANELHVGDDIYYYISKASGDSEAWIKWGNYVKLCGR